MSNNQFNQKVKDLLRAAYLYYQTGEKSWLSDEEFDLKLDYLKNLVENNPELANDDYYKLINNVASGTIADNAAVRFDIPMLSLAKAANKTAVDSFLNKTETAGANKKGWILESKLDGVALAIKYKNGKLSKIITRSSGRIGIDITDNLFELLNTKYIYIEGLTTQLTGKLTNKNIELRGEIFMTLEQFKKTNIIRKKDGGNIYNNPRNAIAGIINSKPTNLTSQIAKTSSQKPDKNNIDNQGLLFSLDNNSPRTNILADSEYKSYGTFLCYSYISDFEIDMGETENYGFNSVLSITRQILQYSQPYHNRKKLFFDID
ncbi:MAG: hypothetical protein LBT99_04445, partial [Bifidobacteriaceae bacterium]|nr:hypothetical protein [Bifidobacteriaceae bacterium]